MKPNTSAIPKQPPRPAITFDNMGAVVDTPDDAQVLPEITVTADRLPAYNIGFDLSSWFKPPRVYYLAAAVALGAYLFSGRKRIR